MGGEQLSPREGVEWGELGWGVSRSKRRFISIFIDFSRTPSLKEPVWLHLSSLGGRGGDAPRILLSSFFPHSWRAAHWGESVCVWYCVCVCVCVFVVFVIVIRGWGG